MLAVTDTSPLHYLILIGPVALLPRLYERVMIPHAVMGELLHPSTPSEVRLWARAMPSWCEVRQPRQTIPRELCRLGAGEREAMVLVEELRADILLVDDDAGRKAARQRALPITGTFGVLGTAGERDWVDFPAAVAQLQATTFRMPLPAVVQAMLARYAARKRQTHSCYKALPQCWVGHAFVQAEFVRRLINQRKQYPERLRQALARHLTLHHHAPARACALRRQISWSAPALAPLPPCP